MATTASEPPLPAEQPLTVESETTDDTRIETADVKFETEEAVKSETEKATESETEKATESETEKATESETEKATESETEKAAESETEKAAESEAEKAAESEAEKAAESEAEKATNSETDYSTISEPSDAESESEDVEEAPAAEDSDGCTQNLTEAETRTKLHLALYTSVQGKLGTIGRVIRRRCVEVLVAKGTPPELIKDAFNTIASDVKAITRVDGDDTYDKLFVELTSAYDVQNVICVFNGVRIGSAGLTRVFPADPVAVAEEKPTARYNNDQLMSAKVMSFSMRGKRSIGPLGFAPRPRAPIRGGYAPANSSPTRGGFVPPINRSNNVPSGRFNGANSNPRSNNGGRRSSVAPQYIERQVQSPIRVERQVQSASIRVIERQMQSPISVEHQVRREPQTIRQGGGYSTERQTVRTNAVMDRRQQAVRPVVYRQEPPPGMYSDRRYQQQQQVQPRYQPPQPRYQATYQRGRNNDNRGGNDYGWPGAYTSTTAPPDYYSSSVLDY